LLWTRKLVDADPTGQIVVDNLLNATGTSRAPEVAHVLIEQAMTQEDHPASALVGQLPP
jgi:hypothetical protein